jgi:hypothetical protein
LGVRRRAAGLLIVALIAVGCSEGKEGSSRAKPGRTTTTTGGPRTTTTAPEAAVGADRAKVDAILTAVVRGTQLLRPGTPDDYASAAEYFRVATAALQAGVSGVPASAIDSSASVFSDMAARIDARVACLRAQSPPDAAAATARCSREQAAEQSQAMKAGVAIRLLIPYGTRSVDQVLAEVGAPPP